MLCKAEKQRRCRFVRHVRPPASRRAELLVDQCSECGRCQLRKEDVLALYSSHFSSSITENPTAKYSRHNKIGIDSTCFLQRANKDDSKLAA